MVTEALWWWRGGGRGGGRASRDGRKERRNGGRVSDGERRKGGEAGGGAVGLGEARGGAVGRVRLVRPEMVRWGAVSSESEKDERKGNVGKGFRRWVIWKLPTYTIVFRRLFPSERPFLNF